MGPFLLLIALHICMYWLLFICVTYDTLLFHNDNHENFRIFYFLTEI